MLDLLREQYQKLTYGYHICSFAEPEEQVTQAVQFIINGLAQNNLCIYISSNVMVEKICRELGKEGKNNTVKLKENLIFKTPEETYLRTGKFDKQDMIACLQELESDASRKGFNGLWVAGDANFLIEKNINSNDLIEYESLLNEMLNQNKIVLFCQYNRVLDNPHLNDVIATHSTIMANYCVIQNPFYQSKHLALNLNKTITIDLKQELALSRIDRLKHLVALELEKSNIQIKKEELELQFRQLVENINEVFWMMDIKLNKFLYISPNFEKIWGVKATELFNDPNVWINSIHIQDRERIKLRFLQKSYKNSDEKYRVILPNKKIAWVRDRTFLVKDNLNEDYRVVGFLEDITQVKNLEEQFYHAQKFDAIGKLAGGIAHDFNNLLAIILSNTDLLLSQQLPIEQKECVEEISKTANRAAYLTKQLLLFGRKKELTITQFNLNDEIDAIAKMLQRLLAENISFKQKLTSDPLVINADKSILDQILINIATNSRDAMPNGGRLLIETNIVEFDEISALQSRDARPGLFACLTVSDTGTGITPEILPKIFDPFFTTKEIGKGSGLGLATVHSIVEQHHGWVHVYSEVGHGTTMRIYLPLISNAVENKKSANLVTNPTSKKTILLIEDEESLRHVIKKILTTNGYCILEAADGDSAISIWEKHKQHIDLVITDLILPNKMNGKDIADFILQHNPKQKIIYMSGYSTEIRSDLNLKENENYLIKPFESNKLINIILKNLRNL